MTSIDSTGSLRFQLSSAFSGVFFVSDLHLGDYAIDGQSPRAVAIPSTEKQLSSLLSFADSEGMSVVPYGNGNLVALGNSPESLDIIVCTTGLKQSIDHRPGDLTATVGAGVSFGALQKYLTKTGQWLPLEAPLGFHRTIGSVLAIDQSTPLTLSQGTARDLVIGMRVASPDGEITKSGGRVVKNVTGFDIAKLHIGALGTLGVILEASFKVWPIPKKDVTLVATYISLNEAIQATQELAQSGDIPDAVEVVASGNGVSAYFRFLGTPIGVQSRLDETRRTLKSSNTQHMETLGSNEATEAWQGITDFGWENAEELLLRFGCLPSRTAALAEMVSSILSKEDLEITIVAGPGRGVIVCTISTASNNNDQVVALIERLRTSAALLDGYVVAEKCSQEIKQRLDVWGFPGDTLSLMRRLKKQVDPRNTLNRGRFLWGIAV